MIRPPSVVHLIIGPNRHGVVRHGLSVALDLGHRVVRSERPDQVPIGELADADIVHVPYTDRLLAERCEDSATAYVQLTAPLLAAGVALSLSLHDLPAGDSALEQRRRAAYQRVVATARGLVVNSRRELTLLGQLDERARSVRRIALPVAARPTPRQVHPGREVVVLGFVFPDRGYEHTIAELPPQVDLLALGAPSSGHEDLPAQLARLAAARGHQLHTTGFVPDEDLPVQLAAAGIPVAPNRRVAASASIATWLAHGRRPLVPDSPYARELLSDWPGTLTLYDPDVPGDLRRAIEAAQADPSLTWLDPGTAAGLTPAEVAAAYQQHFVGCVPDAALAVDERHWAVPGNRWDLLEDLRPEPAEVSVVIPYFEAQAELDLVLTGLARQTHPHARLQVVVADDGSTRAPDLSAAGDLAVHCVRQSDQGFRAAAARNLGAAAADGEVLVFLDGDTVPEPDFIHRLTRLPTLAPDALTVGRRRHAELGGWTAAQVDRWLTGDGPGPVELEEPGWLLDGYRGSRDLLDADERSYRYVISAVLGLHRDLFTELGGFSEEFASYGGEDWELTHRAYVAGAVLAHTREAVAWHIGPDWAGRGVVAGAKNAETLTLTRLLPDPVARGGGQWLPYPAVVITLAETDPAAVLATARSAFASAADCGVWVPDPTTAEVLGDPRIHAGPVPAAVRDRAAVLLELHCPAALHQLPALVATALRHGRVGTPVGAVTATRASRRAARWAETAGLSPDEMASRLFGHRDMPAPTTTAPVDLPHELKQIQQAHS